MYEKKEPECNLHMIIHFLTTAIFVAIPTMLYIRIVGNIDRFEKEPTIYLVAAFLWGALPAIVAGIILEVLLDIPVHLVLGEGIRGQFVSDAVTGPTIEEILKSAALAIIYFTRRRELDGWVDGIIYGSTIGFGFAYVENILYIIKTHSLEEWVSLFFMRVILFGFMHGFWTALTGIGFGVARNMRKPFVQTLVIMAGLSAAIAVHLIHNGALVLANVTGNATLLVALANYGFLALLLIVLGFIAANNDRQILQVYLYDEVPDVISPEDYAGLCSTRSNALARFRLAPQQKRAFIQAAAELAQKKFQLMRMGDESGNATEIVMLREELKRMKSYSSRQGN